ncbi:MAG: flagellin [Synergistaceae bacterium]|nr:flagellin [Synergistaceae bacterium]
MSMIMNHDMTAIMGQRIMQRNSLAMRRSLEKLSSGLRTKIADVDNTAGLAISETMRSRIGGMEKALNNSQDGISMIQTAAGALEQTQSMLMRMRELTVQAANDVLTQQDRSYIQVEINEIRDEINSIANNTQFNRKNILSGDSAAIWSSTDSKVKAIVNGGMRSIDNYGQKYAVDGNFKLNVRAEAGKAQIQKTDILKIKHEDAVEDAILNKSSGVMSVDVSDVPAGRYRMTFAEDAEAATEGVLTSSYGIGGRLNDADTTITFQEIGAPVTKVTFETADGVEIWSTIGSDLFKNKQTSNLTTAEDQAAFFMSVKDEITALAREKGITLTGLDELDEDSTEMNLNAARLNGDAPGLKITYQTQARGVDPLSEVTVNEGQIIGAQEVFSVQVSDKNLDNASVLFEVQSVDGLNNTVKLKATALKLDQDGVSSVAAQDNIILNMGSDGETPNAVNLGKLFGGTNDDPSVTISLGENGTAVLEKGAKFVYSIKAGAVSDNNQNAVQLGITSTADTSAPETWEGGPFNGESVDYILDGSKTGGTELNFRQFFVNNNTGEATQGTITLKTDNTFRVAEVGGEIDIASDDFVAVFSTDYVGKVANSSTKLQDIDKFWTNEGIFILDQPKELTLTQGDGTQAKIMLYGEDTVDDLVRKLNDAVANGLGQAKYVDDAGKFVSFVDSATPGVEGAEGTIVIRSVLAGTKGEITLAGNEDVLKALSLNTIQASDETKYEVTVRNAHDDSLVAQNVKVTGSIMKGVIHNNVDVEFDPMLGISVAWNKNTQNFSFSDAAGDKGVDVVLHLADNTMVFQTGGLEGDDVMISIGDMSAHALGLDGVNVMSRERSAYSTSIIDAAIDRVSMQQASLGGAQNRLEHHIGNLTNETEALIAANSRIRDIDYAQEILNFTKQNILMNSNSAMLAQANQIQQSTIMTLMRI